MTTTAQRAVALLRMGAWFALLTGFVEAGTLLFRRFVLTQTIWSSADVAWMAPAAYLGYFLAPVLLLVVLALIRSELVTTARAALVLGFLAAGISSLVLFGGVIHWTAHLLLAVGAAVQCSRWAARPGMGFERTMNRSLPWLLGALATLAIGMPAWRLVQERRDLARLPGAPAGAPNVMLLIWDTVRAQNVSALGYIRPTTPHLAEWARRGTLYERAMSTAPWTLSSHASMFTGHLTQELSTGWHTPLDDTYPTLAEALTDRGYHTAGFVANLISTSRESGLDRGFSHYEDFPLTPRQVFLSTLVGQRLKRLTPFFRGPLRSYDLKSAPMITDAFLRWLPPGGTPSRPFFAFLNYYDAHDTYYPPPDYQTLFNSTDHKQDRYDGAIHLLDAELQRVLGELERRGLLENTLVILVSDHGELFGEHGLHQHGNSLYLPLLHVPLAIWYPAKVPAGVRIDVPVTLSDLPATVLELALGEPAGKFPGGSLARFWAAAPRVPGADTLVAGVPKGIGTPPEEPVTRGSMNSLITGPLHYILNGDGIEEFYDTSLDPSESQNLATDPARAGQLQAFRATLGSRVPARWIAPEWKDAGPR